MPRKENTMLHRNCRQHAAELKTALDQAQEEAQQNSKKELQALDRAERETRAREDAQTQTENYRARLNKAERDLDAMNSKIQELFRDLKDTQEQVIQYEHDKQEQDQHHKKLCQRRSNAARACMGNAWIYPDRERSDHRAAVARAILDMPLEDFDITFALHLDEDGHATWLIDNKPFNIFDYDQGRSDIYEAGRPGEREVLIRRYGITSRELDTLEETVRRSARTPNRPGPATIVLNA